MRRMFKIDAEAVIKQLKTLFYSYGFPQVLFSDNGRNLVNAKMDQFCKEFGIVHKTSAPGHASSNGLVERCIGNQKLLLKKVGHNWEKYVAAQYAYVNTLSADNEASPAQMFFGRNLRTKLPLLPGQTRLDHIAAENGARMRQGAVAKKSPKCRNLSILKPGQRVAIQNLISKE